MKGYRDKDGFHIVLEGAIESQNLIFMIGEAWRVWQKRAKESTDKEIKEAFNEATSFREKLSIIFIADNYRQGGATKKNPVVARDKYTKLGKRR